MATRKSSSDYSESSIRVLKGLEPVKQRPGMYTRTENPLHIIQEVIDGLPGCFLSSRDPRELAQRLGEAIRNGKRSELRFRAEMYSRDHIARQLLALYERALQPKRA